jgi:hypothetical protein
MVGDMLPRFVEHRADKTGSREPRYPSDDRGDSVK